MFRIIFVAVFLASLVIADSAEAQLLRRLFVRPQPNIQQLPAQPTNNFARQPLEQTRFYYDLERARNAGLEYQIRRFANQQQFRQQQLTQQQLSPQQRELLVQRRFEQQQFLQQQQQRIQQPAQQFAQKQYSLVTQQTPYGPRVYWVEVPNPNQRFAGNNQQFQPQRFQQTNNQNQFAGQQPAVVAQTPSPGTGNSTPTLQQPNVVAPASLSSVTGKLETPAVGFNPPLSEPTGPAINDPNVAPASANVVEFKEVEPISLNELAPGEAPTIDAPTTDGPALNPPSIDAPALTPPADTTPLESEAKSILKKK